MCKEEKNVFPIVLQINSVQHNCSISTIIYISTTIKTRSEKTRELKSSLLLSVVIKIYRSYFNLSLRICHFGLRDPHCPNTEAYWQRISGKVYKTKIVCHKIPHTGDKESLDRCG